MRPFFVYKSPASSTELAHMDNETNEEDLDAMRARAGLLRTSILKQQMELQKLETQILCCSRGKNTPNDPIEAVQGLARQSYTTFMNSANVLARKLQRVQSRTGRNNQQWPSAYDFIATQVATGGRILGNLLQNPTQLTQLAAEYREIPALVPHWPAILARLDRLEGHVAPILERVLNNRRHLPSIEPYLDEILERFDDIEPHLPWILEHVDALAPYTGLLLKHIDELLLYADVDAQEGFAGDDGYGLAEQLLPYLEVYASKLDLLGPHLVLLRPHVPLLLRHGYVARITPHIDRLFARGYRDLGASANMDVLLWWFGWTMRVPGLRDVVPRLFFALPGSPRIVSFLANRLPKRFARKFRCRGVTCSLDGDYGGGWNRLVKPSPPPQDELRRGGGIARPSPS